MTAHHRPSSQTIPQRAAARDAAARPHTPALRCGEAPALIRAVPSIRRPFRPDVVVSAAPRPATAAPDEAEAPWYVARLNADVPARWFEVMPAAWVEQIRRCAGPRGRVDIWTLAAATGLPSWQVRAHLERACRAQAAGDPKARP